MTNMWSSYNFTLYSFLLYEVCVGMLYPTYSKIKSEYLPEKSRGTLMNIFKIPLNLIVIFLLLNMNTLFTLRQLLMINLGLSVVVFITHILFFNKSKKDIYARPDLQTRDNNLLDERKRN
jgi:ATP/ADP translocase